MNARNNERDQGATIPIATSADAVVTPASEALVELYTPQGGSVRVHPSDVDAVLMLGFRRGPGDPRDTARRLRVMVEAALPAIDVYVEGVLEDGEIDTGDAAAQATANVAMNEVGQLWGLLCNQLAFYPVRQGAPIRMIAPDGQEHNVDPGQVAAFARQGWEAVKE